MYFVQNDEERHLSFKNSEIVAWLNSTMPNQTVKYGLKVKKIILPQMNFFLKKTTNKIFMYLLTPFILQNF